jgi:hypothetical protein
VAAVLASHPQALVGEMDARTAATFLTEVRQQNGAMLPFVVTQRALQETGSRRSARPSATPPSASTSPRSPPR